MEIGRKKQWNVIWQIIFLIIIIAVFVAIYFWRAAIFQWMESEKLVPMPERFTELYFDDPSSLPQQASAGSPISFSFTIQNDEGVATEYPYEVYFESSSSQAVIFASGSVVLPEDATDTIPVTYVFPEASGTATGSARNTKRLKSAAVLPSANETGTVVVELTSLDQQIDFLLPGNN